MSGKKGNTPKIHIDKPVQESNSPTPKAKGMVIEGIGKVVIIPRKDFNELLNESEKLEQLEKNFKSMKARYEAKLSAKNKAIFVLLLICFALFGGYYLLFQALVVA